ncbi:MAG TPA: hypothetical protein VF500_00860, partial [Mucilaginibacter sp.]
MHHKPPYKTSTLLLATVFFLLFTGITTHTFGQVQVPADSVKADSLRIKEKVVQPAKPTDTLYKQYDFGDLVRN